MPRSPSRDGRAQLRRARAVRDRRVGRAAGRAQGPHPRRRREPLDGVEERFEARERTEVEAARREDARGVHDALGTLPEEQRRTIELAYFGGFSQSQIAEMLEMPIGTVKGRMRLGLEKLRKQLTDVVIPGELA